HILARVGEDARRKEHDGGDADPRAAEEAEKAERPFGVVRDDGERLFDPAERFELPHDGPAVTEHEAEARQGDEAWDGVGEHGDDAPDALEFEALSVV